MAGVTRSADVKDFLLERLDVLELESNAKVNDVVGRGWFLIDPWGWDGRDYLENVIGCELTGNRASQDASEQCCEGSDS